MDMEEMRSFKWGNMVTELNDRLMMFGVLPNSPVPFKISSII